MVGTFSDFAANETLDHWLKGAAAPTTTSVWIALHRATTLTTDAAAGANSVTVDDTVEAGVTITIDAGGATEESHNVASVTDNGDGTFTLGLDGTILAEAHSSGEDVAFDIDNDLGTLLEPAGGGYARLEVEGTTGRTWVAAASRATENNEEWTFPQATGDWGLVTGFAVMDASTGGNGIVKGNLTTPKQVQTNDTFKFPAGDLDVTFQT